MRIQARRIPDATWICCCLSLCLATALGCTRNDAGEALEAEPPATGANVIVEVPPSGDLSDVDTTATRDVVARLARRSTREAAIRDVTATPAEYAPPALYAAASAMFSDGRKNESLFWFYLGQLRARSDANKCRDISARQAVQVLNLQYGAPINEFAFKDTDKLRKVVDEVLEWDRTHPRSYDPRWIALHGMDAFLGTSDAFSDESKWKQIDESTRADYREGFEQGLVHFLRLKAELDTNRDGVITDEERKAYEEKELARVREEIEQTTKKLEIETPR